MICNRCGKEHPGTFGSGKFCSRSCANKRTPSNEQKAKVSNKLRGRKRVPRSADVIEKWRETTTNTWAQKKLNRAAEILTVEFETLTDRERRERILTEQKEQCACCGVTQWWNNQPLKFELDHISGNRNDNSRTNLRLVCPNCHSQTPTYKAKNNSGKRVSDLEFITALNSEPSIYKALVTLGINLHGGNYTRARKLIVKYNLDQKL